MLTKGKQLGRYVIVAPLGKGGMGEVYRARDSRLGRDVAIKVLPEQFAQDPNRRARFEREAKVVAALSHPNVLAIHDYGTEQGISFAVMELLEGESLRERLARFAMPWRQALEIGLAVAEGMDVVHSKGIIHRDLKPDNLFLTTDGRVKILDFGLARIELVSSQETASHSPALTQTGAVMGTVAYMSPEQVRGKELDGRSDLFSLGCVLYEMLSGKPPFRRKTSADTMAAILHDEPAELPYANLLAPPKIEKLLERSLAKRLKDRYPSARELASAFRELLLDAQKSEPLTVSSLKPHVIKKSADDAQTITHAGSASTQTKIILTTNKKWRKSLFTLFGCGLTTLLLCGTMLGGIHWLMNRVEPMLNNWFKDEIGKQNQWKEIALFWRPPPADAGPEFLFPEQVKEFQRIKHDKNADVTDFAIQANGHRAIYKTGTKEIELFVYRAAKLEKEALLRRAYDVVDPKVKKFGYQSVRGSVEGDFLGYDIGPPDQHGVFWWDQDWLFFARSSVVADPGIFLKNYLAILSGKVTQNDKVK